ncbi:MAG: hypothetical protein ACTS5A_04045, partial [Candidatus Hodgkinia cicadicola]
VATRSKHASAGTFARTKLDLPPSRVYRRREDCDRVKVAAQAQRQRESGHCPNLQGLALVMWA